MEPMTGDTHMAMSQRGCAKPFLLHLGLPSRISFIHLLTHSLPGSLTALVQSSDSGPGEQPACLGAQVLPSGTHSYMADINTGGEKTQ